MRGCIMRCMQNEEDAVSPVIGVILLVAITVILGAIIAAFTFGMVGTVQKSYSVGASAQIYDDKIIVTYEGGPDQNSLSSTTPLKVTLNGGEGFTPFTAPTKVGDMVSATHTGDGQDHVIVVATFNDGTQQVILDTYI